MCQGVEFTAVDHLTSGLSEPPVFEEVEFEAPEYPDDPELTFDTLSTHTFAWPGLYAKGTRQGQDTIVDMGQSIITLSFTAKYAEMAYTYAKDKADSACNAQPSLACVAVIAGNGGCLMIPSKYACEVAKLSLTNLFFALWKTAQLAVDTLEHAFYILTISSADEADTNQASIATLENLATFDTYVQGALNTINKNIFKQHSEMREHLQDRHQDMTNDIVEFLEESTNTVAGYFTLQSDWLHKNLCEIYKEVADVNNCDGSEETLLSLVGTSLWNKMLQIEAQGVDLMKNTQLMQSEGIDEVGYAGEKQVHTKDADVFSEEMQGKVDALSDDVQSKVDALSNDVQGKVDALSNDVHSLSNDVQSKVDDLQSKVDALSNDMQSMNGKVNDLLEDLKVMMTKMMDMMARE
jgi:outer membrane murein-binding lipoprotein Lpp